MTRRAGSIRIEPASLTTASSSTDRSHGGRPIASRRQCAVRRFHTLERELFTGGRAKVSAQGRGLGAALLAFVAGLPALGENVESAEGERFAFDIDVVFPIIGDVVHYEGVLIERPQLDEFEV